MAKAGEMISERYRLIAPLASGGMGTVWRAETSSSASTSPSS